MVSMSPCVRPHLIPRYVAENTGLALAQGFTFASWMTQPNRNLIAALCVSPDRKVLAVISGGSLAGMTVRKLLLYSRTEAIQLVSCSDPGLENIHPFRFRKRLINASFDELFDRHFNDTCAGQTLLQFGADPLDAYLRLEQDFADKLCESRLAQFCNSDRTAYRMTLKGALWMARRGVSARNTSEDADRIKIARPSAELVSNVFQF